MKLSNQALGSVMMALQKSLMEQSDVTETLKGFELIINSDDELVVTNPPMFEVKQDSDD